MAAMVQHQPRTEGTYTFASQPKAVPQRKKYRDPASANENGNAQPFYGNIMYDRRVIRGSTYAQRVLPASAGPDPIEVQRQQEARRRAIAKRRAQQQLRVRSPEPVEGRQHADVQTELYLEELSDRIEEADMACQTDAFLDRPPSPMFIPAKSGVDCATQIQDGELFDFNTEVKPVLEVIVGKTVEQSLIEVMEEEELSNLREQQRHFQELRNAEMVEQQRLEEEDRRRRLEKDRRVQQQAEAAQKEAETSEKIAARAFAQSYLSDLVPSVFGMLSDNGYFYDPVERAVERDFMPWLMESVDVELHKAVISRHVLDAVIRDVVQARTEQFNQLEIAESTPPAEPEPEPSADTEPVAEATDENTAEQAEPAEGTGEDGDADLDQPVDVAATDADDTATATAERESGDEDQDDNN